MEKRHVVLLRIFLGCPLYFEGSRRYVVNLRNLRCLNQHRARTRTIDDQRTGFVALLDRERTALGIADLLARCVLDINGHIERGVGVRKYGGRSAPFGTIERNLESRTRHIQRHFCVRLKAYTYRFDKTGGSICFFRLCVIGAFDDRYFCRYEHEIAGFEGKHDVQSVLCNARQRLFEHLSVM